MRPSLALPGSEAHLWVTCADEARDSALLAGYDALLSDDERDKRDRYVFEKDRHLCLVSRALVRTTLSRYAPVGPAEWRFEENEYGCPAIAEPRSARERGLRFNLSHTRGMVVCLVARQREVGVDVEDRERRGRLLDVADRYFSPTEVRALRALPAEERLERFFVYWTLKESYIKARGMGLAIPLSQFSFHVDEPTRGIYISFDPRLDDDPLRWQFTMMSHGRAHRIAACVSRTGHEHVRFVVREGVPSAE